MGVLTYIPRSELVKTHFPNCGPQDHDNPLEVDDNLWVLNIKTLLTKYFVRPTKIGNIDKKDHDSKIALLILWRMWKLNNVKMRLQRDQ